MAALTRHRISHVDQNYLRAETYAAANAPLIAAQADIGLAQAWGGGLLAAVDGVRFVVPVTSSSPMPLIALRTTSPDRGRPSSDLGVP